MQCSIDVTELRNNPSQSNGFTAIIKMNLNSYCRIHMQQFLNANPGGSVVAGKQEGAAANMQQ